MSRARHWGAVAAAIAAAAVIAALGALAVAPRGDMASGTASATVPPNDAVVVATLQTSGAARSPDLIGALRATREAPDDPEMARAAARLLIAEGRAAGDSRLVGAALGVLRPVMDPPEAETLYVAADARQYQHDFQGALELLGLALSLDPNHVNALLTRATVKLVQGRVGAAQADCALLAALRQDVGFLCQSTALIITPQAPQVSERLAQIVAKPGLLEPTLSIWATGLLGEIAVLRGDDAAGRGYLETVLKRSPGDLRLRLVLADLLLRSDEAAAVLPLLADAPAIDAVFLRRALVGRALGKPDEASEAAALERVTINRDLGVDAHAREDAMYHLLLADDPEAALDRALVNWERQREVPDAQLLVDAAVAAGEPGEAAPVLDWIAEEGIDVPTLMIPDAVRQAAP